MVSVVVDHQHTQILLKDKDRENNTIINFQL